MGKDMKGTQMAYIEVLVSAVTVMRK